MKVPVRKQRYKWGLLLLFCASRALWSQTVTGPAAPPTAAEETKETIHGVVVSDPYQWLEDSISARTRAWIDSQQKYTASLLDQRPDIAGLRKDVFELADIEEAHRILFRAGHYFILKKSPGHAIASLYLRDGENGKEESLIDPNSWSGDHSDTIELLNISPDGKLVAYAVRHGGRDQVSIHFYNVDAKRDLPDILPEARYIDWPTVPLLPNSSGLFYVKIEDAGPRLYHHKFGAPIENDKLVFGSALGPEIIMLVDMSEDGATLAIHALHGASGAVDVYVKDLRDDSPVKPVVQGIASLFSAQAEGNHLYIRTNWQAPLGRIMVTEVGRPEVDQWRTLIPEGPDTIEGFQAVGGKLLLNYMKDAHSELRIFDGSGKAVGEINLPGLGSVTVIDGQWSSPVVCFSYSSFQTPATFFSYSLETGNRSVISAPKVSPRLAEVEVEQMWYQSKDGTRVPMFIAHKKDFKKDGAAPVLLYGYGGFNWGQLPTFSPEEAVWLERGGVYAVANIRGGNEFGEAWHKAGELEHKQNTFDDFIAAAQWLIDHHYTNPRRLAIQGLSNGGLLVTAAITQQPDLFAAAIARYPLIDMVRYERFSIARWWVPEYGSVSDATQFKTLYSYSPYHHVRKGTKYPAVLLITGDGDTRVDPSHARKMTAMLQGATASGRPVMVLYDTKSGHSSSLSTEAEVNQTTAELAFLTWQLGWSH
jgi:prolyl oligopeptidase